ncbi:ABC transporter permease [Nocardia macrotermitis]|uniref:Putative D,D-dipeptide transport system permease protein DdpC n=1 Tax=Nocardia macrotermitis TaxID=2585198 RepID=A0A7K0CU32_9NOCA|nr:ABC transporter permease subunit [Nocardia macrotermitis]MQY16979.1 putative D,D-dipeptide transport system permease protein DdpC [Nocardia macrotermitis]
MSVRRWFALSLVVVPLLIAVVGPAFTGSVPSARQAPFGPSSWSPFGTDRLGRDVLATALVGGRTFLLVAALTVIGSYTVGFVIGVAAAAASRAWLDELLMRPMDVLLCLPSLLIIMVAALRTRGSVVAIAVAIGIALVAPIARFVRMAARPVVHGPVMDALRMQGESRRYRYVNYTVREMIRPIAADVGVRFTAAVYILASANFLGLGFDTTSTDWAVSVAANKDALTIAPWSVALPAGLIVLLMIGVNLLCDDLLADPRTVAMRESGRVSRGE